MIGSRRCNQQLEGSAEAETMNSAWTTLSDKIQSPLSPLTS